MIKVISSRKLIKTYIFTACLMMSTISPIVSKAATLKTINELDNNRNKVVTEQTYTTPVNVKSTPKVSKETVNQKDISKEDRVSVAKISRKASNDKFKGMTLDEVLKSVGKKPTKAFKQRLAATFKIENYQATKKQDNLILEYLTGKRAILKNYDIVHGVQIPDLSSYEGNSLAKAIKKYGLKNTMSYKKKLATALGIENYVGTKAQNQLLLEYLVRDKRLPEPYETSIINDVEIPYIDNYNGNSLDEALERFGIKPTLRKKKMYAKALGINNYKGTKKQDLLLLDYLTRNTQLPIKTTELNGVQIPYIEAYEGKTLEGALKNVGIEPTEEYMETLAKSLGILNYKGSESQKQEILKYLTREKSLPTQKPQGPTVTTPSVGGGSYGGGTYGGGSSSNSNYTKPACKHSNVVWKYLDDDYEGAYCTSCKNLVNKRAHTKTDITYTVSPDAIGVHSETYRCPNCDIVITKPNVKCDYKYVETKNDKDILKCACGQTIEVDHKLAGNPIYTCHEGDDYSKHTHDISYNCEYCNKPIVSEKGVSCSDSYKWTADDLKEFYECVCGIKGTRDHDYEEKTELVSINGEEHTVKITETCKHEEDNHHKVETLKTEKCEWTYTYIDNDYEEAECKHGYKHNVEHVKDGETRFVSNNDGTHKEIYTCKHDGEEIVVNPEIGCEYTVYVETNGNGKDVMKCPDCGHTKEFEHAFEGEVQIVNIHINETNPEESTYDEARYCTHCKKNIIINKNVKVNLTWSFDEDKEYYEDPITKIKGEREHSYGDSSIIGDNKYTPCTHSNCSHVKVEEYEHQCTDEDHTVDKVSRWGDVVPGSSIKNPTVDDALSPCCQREVTYECGDTGVENDSHHFELDEDGLYTCTNPHCVLSLTKLQYKKKFPNATTTTLLSTKENTPIAFDLDYVPTSESSIEVTDTTVTNDAITAEPIEENEVTPSSTVESLEEEVIIIPEILQTTDEVENEQTQENVVELDEELDFTLDEDFDYSVLYPEQMESEKNLTKTL